MGVRSKWIKIQRTKVRAMWILYFLCYLPFSQRNPENSLENILFCVPWECTKHTKTSWNTFFLINAEPNNGLENHKWLLIYHRIYSTKVDREKGNFSKTTPWSPKNKLYGAPQTGSELWYIIFGRWTCTIYSRMVCSCQIWRQSVNSCDY